MEPTNTTSALKKKATELGFSLCGVCPAISPPGAARLDEWLSAGFAGEMKYLHDRREAYDDPDRVLHGVRSIVMLAMNYRTADPVAPGLGQGRVSRYAWSDIDYHDLIRPRLNILADFLSQRIPIAKSRGIIDTAPLLERDFAVLAGLGWVGKNTLLLNKHHGSWFFLAALLTDAVLDYDSLYETDHCGTCRACLDACPTAAFPQPYVLDASRCISYLTIELRSAIPHELRSGMEDWVFGCDVCQEVCPWNSRSPHSDEPRCEPRADSNPLDLIALFKLDDAAFRARFRNTPLWRPRRRGLLRNAAIVLGNHPTATAVPALACGLNDDESLIRGACAWALGRYSEPAAFCALELRLTVETDASVRREIEHAIEA
ncbi:MAG TPA: tRNA epoxyqueuosine(34) reductase QueG, partial [Lacipirellulaceae bacterium]|nr:tRNA epoxyqueuosine(34) reductase QueG [Lacipirellulaceae bacterium]